MRREEETVQSTWSAGTLRTDASSCAFGKTVVASKLIAERGVTTLVLVHRRQLLDQWRERLAVFLDLPIKTIGQIVGGKASRSGCVDVGLLQSLQRKGEVKDFVAAARSPFQHLAR
jgi:superfamily II DNA or RNA helicase